MRRPHFLALPLLLSAVLTAVGEPIDRATMERIHAEARTPHKVGVVIQPPAGKKVDCPNVFRHNDRWWMVYIQLETHPVGYSTQLAVSDNLIDWKPLGTILPQGPEGSWDACNAAGGLALFDTAWGGGNGIGQHDGRYWASYLGGKAPGYETPPLSISLAHTTDPTRAMPWEKLPAPVLNPHDTDARPWETFVLYKSHIIRDPTRTLGAPFVMFYNAKAEGGSEKIGLALSHDLLTWKRHLAEPVIENAAPDARRSSISGDPQVVRIGDLWVMFYFGAFWKPGAFDTFAASRDLVHWTKWDGPDLIAPSAKWDAQYAHKPWLLKHEGVVYHFYCAVDKRDNRTIALATSKPVRP